MRNNALRNFLRTPHFTLGMAALIALSIAYQFRAPITLDMASNDEEIYLTRGFYPPEETFGVTYRWTSGEARIVLPGVGSGTSLHLHVNLQELRPSSLAPQPVTISLNDRSVITFTPTTQLNGYDFDLPASDLRGDVILNFQSDTFIPKNSIANNTDDRSLGLFIDQLQITDGSGLVVPPLIVWLLLAGAVLGAYAFGQAVNWGTPINVGIGIVGLLLEIIGIVAARTWTAHNAIWWTGSIVAAWLIAQRLKRPKTEERRQQLANDQQQLNHSQGSTAVSSQRSVVKIPYLNILIVFLAWRLALIAIPIVGSDVIGTRECCPEVLPKPLTSWSQAAFGDWYRWDAIWYGSIAQNGYQYFGTREASNVAFFPGFPLLNGIISHTIGLPVEVSGPVVSTLLALIACYFLYRLTLRETDDADTAYRSIVYFLAFPAAYYLAIGYSEALYVVCVLAAFLFAREGKWGWCAVAAFFAGLARLHGALLIVPLAYEYWRHASRRSIARKNISSVFAAPIGVLAFMGYLGAQFGKPLAYFEIQTLFFKGIRADAFPTFPGTTFANYLNGLLTGTPSTESVAVMGAMILLIVLTIEVWARLPKIYGVYMLTVTLFSLASGDLISMPRFVVPMFPGFITLA
ncbi:MAG TPA: mannosyltransferase family protein, partial [Anaerolineae bacterium]|nr:mannosyltransferase family protein [Anaerolineae bacterium]